MDFVLLFHLLLQNCFDRVDVTSANGGQVNIYQINAHVDDIRMSLLWPRNWGFELLADCKRYRSPLPWLKKMSLFWLAVNPEHSRPNYELTTLPSVPRQ
jgi:hypothetical protein